MAEQDDDAVFASAFGTEPPKTVETPTAAPEQPAKPVQSEATPTEAPTAAEPAVPATEVAAPQFDPSTLSDDAKAAWEKLVGERDAAQNAAKDKEAAALRTQEEFKALHNRLAPAQRRISELETAAAQARTKPAAAPVPETPEPDFLDSAEFKTYEREFPDEAKVLRRGHEANLRNQRRLEAEFAKMSARLESEVAPRLAEAADLRQHVILNEQLRILTDAHPDWFEVKKSDPYKAWLEGQPDTVKDMALYSQDANDAIWLVNTFKRDNRIKELEAKPPVDAKAAETLAARKANLQQSVTPAVGPTATAGRAQPQTADDVFAAAFPVTKR